MPNHLMMNLNAPPPDAESSGMIDDGKSQDNGSATTTILFRTTKSSKRKFPKKLKKKKKREKPQDMDCDKTKFMSHYDPLTKNSNNLKLLRKEDRMPPHSSV